VCRPSPLKTYELGNLWRWLAPPKPIGNWPLTSLKQRRANSGPPSGPASPVPLWAAAGRRPSAIAVCLRQVAAATGIDRIITEVCLKSGFDGPEQAADAVKTTEPYSFVRQSQQ